MAYHWTLAEVLNMPAHDFFRMLKVGRELLAKQRYSMLSDLCLVAQIPNLTAESVGNLRKTFLDWSISEDERKANEEFVTRVKLEADRQKAERGQALDAGGPEAKIAVLSVFAAKKRADYGRR